MNLYYSADYVAAAQPFDTTRKAAWIADSLRTHPVAGVTVVAPEPLGWADIERVHARRYVEAVRTGEPRDLAESQGFAWDPGLGDMVLASNGGVVAAALDALRDGAAGSLSSGLHHARRGYGRGFCTFNGLALAAFAALDAGAGGVLILDLDAHCGGGTMSLVGGERRITQCDVAVDTFDAYDDTERASLTIVRRAAEYLDAVEVALEGAARGAGRLGLCLYNAGMDPHERCRTGGLAGITQQVLAGRERRVFAWCRERGLPVAYVLAGGYVSAGLDEAALVRLHRLTIEAAAGMAGNLDAAPEFD